MGYPGSATLYEVAQSLLFPFFEAAHAHVERFRKPNKPPPPPSLRGNLTRRLTPRPMPRLTPRRTQNSTPGDPKLKTTPTRTQPLTEPNKCGIQNMCPKKCEHTSHFNT